MRDYPYKISVKLYLVFLTEMADGVDETTFNSFAGGICANTDYSYLIEEFENEESIFIGEES